MPAQFTVNVEPSKTADVELRTAEDGMLEVDRAMKMEKLPIWLLYMKNYCNSNWPSRVYDSAFENDCDTEDEVH